VRFQENGWQEPYESRGSRGVLWGTGGEIPPVYPASNNLNASEPCETVNIQQLWEALQNFCYHAANRCFNSLFDSFKLTCRRLPKITPSVAPLFIQTPICKTSLIRT